MAEDKTKESEEERRDDQVNDSSSDSSKDIEQPREGDHMRNVVYVQSMFENWFLDYASYAILDRALPDVYDGLKPVQRRILHSMSELEDGRMNKVANIVGNTMKYHPHGDASIADAIVQLGQKELTIDTQGNWGNIYTGDPAAASRYIEARLTKFALEVVFNPKITQWKLSYDGRNKEPIQLPIRFPLLLAQGVKGIAVGMATKILPHNFNELLDASVAVLENKPFELYPDFPTGGSIDVSKYADGTLGGKVISRAKISIQDNKTLVITEIPYGTNTVDLIQNSITPAIEKGKLKIRKIDDQTSKGVEIVLHLQPGTSPDQTIDALYAFTDCQVNINPNPWVIHNGKPAMLSVSEILRVNTYNTVEMLRKDLEIFLHELEGQWHWLSLEKIFFEHQLYKELEKDTDSWDTQIDNILRDFKAYQKLLKREVTREDVLKLCEKPVRKISKFDIKKVENDIANVEMQMEETQNHLDHIIDYTINYFKQLKKKYGKGRERRTEIKNFDTINVVSAAVANQKLYVNKAEGFIGTALKKDENVELACECSDIDDIIVFMKNGTFTVTKVPNKQFIAKNIIHVGIYKRNDDRTVYNMIYSKGKNGPAMVKRFPIGGITRNKEYDLTSGEKGTEVLYFTANPNGEAEKVKVYVKNKPNLKKKTYEFDFSTLAIKGRASKGNILSKNPLARVELSEKGVSTLSAIGVWFDPNVMRLNNEERGDFLGDFKKDDKIISVYKSGNYRITGYELTTHFEDDLAIIRKYNSHKVITAIYYNKKEDRYFIKRFNPQSTDKTIDFIPMEKDVKLMEVSIDYLPQLEVKYHKKDPKVLFTEVIDVSEFIDTQGIKAKGKRLNLGTIKGLKWLDPLPYDEPEDEPEETETEESGTEIVPGSIEDIEMADALERFHDDTPTTPSTPAKPADGDNDNDDSGTQLELF
ncbi:MAG: DNA gyrase/topoisomerase IV subunit A [Bacteroidales bacterium]|nr:DNA gyrase/topoisomerase IV subunit A [Bacteroidales bacterium]